MKGKGTTIVPYLGSLPTLAVKVMFFEVQEKKIYKMESRNSINCNSFIRPHASSYNKNFAS